MRKSFLTIRRLEIYTQLPSTKHYSFSGRESAQTLTNGSCIRARVQCTLKTRKLLISQCAECAKCARCAAP